MLEEVLELPVEQPAVERLLEGDALPVALRRAVELDEQQLIDGALEELDNPRLRLTLQRVPQRQVPNVLEDEQAGLRSVDVELGDGDADAGQEPMHVDVRQLGGRLREHRQLIGG